MAPALSQRVPAIPANAASLHRPRSSAYPPALAPRRGPRSALSHNFRAQLLYPNVAAIRPDLCPTSPARPESPSFVDHTHGPHNPPTSSSLPGNPYRYQSPGAANQPPLPLVLSNKYPQKGWRTTARKMRRPVRPRPSSRAPREGNSDPIQPVRRLP